MRTLPGILAMAAAILAALPPWQADAVAQAPPAQAPPVFRSLSELVLLHVAVKDGRNRYLPGLPMAAFTIYDNDRAQDIRFFMDEDAPATIGLLVDSSGSMLPNRDQVLAAVETFVETSHAGDEIFALAFNDSVRAALPRDQPFTGDSAVLRSALGRVPAFGQTALYDALAQGLEYLEQGRHDRKALVVVSDGADNASRTEYADVAARVQASDVVVHVVQLKDPNGRHPHAKRLTDLARATGGEAFAPNNIHKVNEVLRRIAQDIRRAYVLAYAPTESALDGALRRIRVEVRAPGHRRVNVRTRAAHSAGTSPQPPATRGRSDH